MKTIATATIAIMLIATHSTYGKSASELNIAAGRKLFVRHCSECHGPEGQGTDRAPSIIAFVRATETPVLQSFIKNGNLRRGMPSWSQLPDQRLSQIAAYLKSLNSPQE